MGSPERLKPACREALEDGANDVFVSAASIWELRLKASRGKLTLPDEFEESLRETGFNELPVGWDHAKEASALPFIHHDPFDRLLVAQSLVENLVLVTRDTIVLRYETALMRG